MASSKRTTIVFAALVAALLMSAGSAEAQSRSSVFGIGGMVGDPFGLSMKLRLGDVMALDFGAGWEAWGYGNRNDDAGQIHVDFVWHIDILSLQRTDMAFYFGVGPQIEFDDDDNPRNDIDDSHFWFGGRVPLGMVWDFKRRHLDVFVESVPGFLVGDNDWWNDGNNHFWFDFDFSAGARYWF